MSVNAAVLLASPCSPGRAAGSATTAPSAASSASAGSSQTFCGLSRDLIFRSVVFEAAVPT